MLSFNIEKFIAIHKKVCRENTINGFTQQSAASLNLLNNNSEYLRDKVKVNIEYTP